MKDIKHDFRILLGILVKINIIQGLNVSDKTKMVETNGATTLDFVFLIFFIERFFKASDFLV